MHIQDSHWQAAVVSDGEGRLGAGGRSAPLRVDAQRNLEHVLRAAREVFGELGYGAPMEDVARRARVGVGTVYRRFPSKDVLVRRIAEEETSRLTDQARTALGQEEEPWSALSRFLRTSVASGAGRLLPPQVLRVGVDADDPVGGRGVAPGVGSGSGSGVASVAGSGVASGVAPGAGGLGFEGEAGALGQASEAGARGREAGAGGFGHEAGVGGLGHEAGGLGQASDAGSRGQAAEAGVRGGHEAAAGSRGHEGSAGIRGGHEAAAGAHGQAAEARVPQQRQAGQPDLRVVGQRLTVDDLDDPGAVELLEVVGQLVERAREAGELRVDVTVADVLLVIATAAPSLPDAAQQAAASARLLDILLEGLRSRPV
ncbi:helix-turn-helix transcriptional regulator [Streptomyces liangshanensis]|uniref:Helix-turn-helix transcriptional regulator n=1 Tax=Streptomyces liangshanensis TaxID=2717324 RepID=A0A6G9H147_9ACTN|nr:helix-turn-helix transcriptional regulator [Streptomyces liangshanensis]